ncbi:hypothetical protein cpu_09500 [Carboxydothermus pertinax]|uniref:DUF1540 domain-containing protein n=1 Tax=Carboxydothermus pertinax TaxID=870242 RepID=A0A1L8CU44_9THEO|nr:hypothetical protein cpu_09500 [Carboxydothermus pertinax]
MKIHCQSECLHEVNGFCNQEKVELKQEGLMVICSSFVRRIPDKDTTTVFYYHYNDNLWT